MKKPWNDKEDDDTDQFESDPEVTFEDNAETEFNNLKIRLRHYMSGADSWPELSKKVRESEIEEKLEAWQPLYLGVKGSQLILTSAKDDSTVFNFESLENSKNRAGESTQQTAFKLYHMDGQRKQYVGLPFISHSGT